MKRTILIICTMLLLPLFVFGAEAEDLAREFFRMDMPQELLSAEALESLSDEYDTGLLRGLLDIIMVNGMDYQALEDLCVPIIMQEYTEQELQDIISFLKTPAGVKYSRNNTLGKSYLSVALEAQIQAATGESDDWIRQMLSELFDIFKLDDPEDEEDF
jgi:hypothetical protein